MTLKPQGCVDPGACHLDPLVARHIAGLDADAICLKIGINIFDQASLNERTFAASVLGFILAIRDATPTAPVLLVSPCWATDRELKQTKPHSLKLSLSAIRTILADLVAKLVRRGDANLFYRSGLDLLAESDARDAFMPDGIHPNAAGYERIAARFAPIAFGHAGCLLPGRWRPDDAAAPARTRLPE